MEKEERHEEMMQNERSKGKMKSEETKLNEKRM